MKIAYPVIFTEVNTNILIEIPDLGILTESNDEAKEKGTLADAIAMARDAIGIACISLEDEGKPLVKPSAIFDIDVTNGTFSDEGVGIVSLVDVDLSVYRRRIEQKTVRRNVTLPNWLNLEAENAQINVSRVLQEALMMKLGINK